MDWHTRRSGRVLASVVLCAAVLAVTSCTAGPGTGDGDAGAETAGDRPSATPTPTEVALDTGEPATVTLPAEGGEEAELEVAVTGVADGSIDDLSEFRLDEQAQSSTPYYADVRITNTGSADPSSRSVALWGLDSEGTVRPPADVVGPFRKCQDEPLPKRFTSGDSARTCLLYLVPEGATLEAVQYRFDSRPPFSWPVG